MESDFLQRKVSISSTMVSPTILVQFFVSMTYCPRYFKPKTIEGVGTYQDAGQLRNNPIFIALSEVEAIFPHTQEPDFVVSLGTGGPRSNGRASGTSSRGLVKDGTIPRCFRAFW